MELGVLGGARAARQPGRQGAEQYDVREQGGHDDSFDVALAIGLAEQAVQFLGLAGLHLLMDVAGLMGEALAVAEARTATLARFVRGTPDAASFDQPDCPATGFPQGFLRSWASASRPGVSAMLPGAQPSRPLVSKPQVCKADTAIPTVPKAAAIRGRIGAIMNAWAKTTNAAQVSSVSRPRGRPPSVSGAAGPVTVVGVGPWQAHP